MKQFAVLFLLLSAPLFGTIVFAQPAPKTYTLTVTDADVVGGRCR